MPHRRTTFSKFIIESLRRRLGSDPELAALLNDVMTGCKLIAAAAARGPSGASGGEISARMHAAGDETKPLEVVANEIMLRCCEFGGQLCGIVSEQMEQPFHIPDNYPRGRYLLVLDPLDGSSNIDVNMAVGTFFSVLHAPDGVSDPDAADFLQPGSHQVAAGYAIHGPVSMLVITLGDGVHGFTLNREIGAYMLTHPSMVIPDATSEVAVKASNARLWEPPIRRYVEECVEGAAGPRGLDFSMRWIDSMAADLHRILIRGGLFMFPRDTSEQARSGRLRLLYEANPMAMIAEQAGGAASTGRERLLDVAPTDIHQRVPVILGSRREVERVVRYHSNYDRGEPLTFTSPLFNMRSLFRND